MFNRIWMQDAEYSENEWHIVSRSTRAKSVYQSILQFGLVEHTQTMRDSLWHNGNWIARTTQCVQPNSL